jgi:ERCC4-type nuclease|nr:ERCC4 domain-containing protein [Neorhizobium tomejilense]
MQIKLNIWDAPNGGYSRIYVNGLPIDGKVYLHGSKGRTLVKFEGDPGTITSEYLLDAATAIAECDSRNFDELLRAVRLIPAPKRGRRPGSTAAGGKGGGWNYFDHAAGRPEEWTAEHTLSLDPNRWKDPLPEETVLLVDHREPREMITFFQSVEKLKVEIVALETGDFVIPGRLIIERKTAADLVRSVVDEDKRVFYQTERMANSDLPGVLLLEGNIYQQTNMQINAITGTLSFISAIQGTSIIPTLSPTHSADMVVKLARHSIYGLGYELALRGLGPKEPRLAASFVLEGIPGVSEGTAKMLLRKFGSIARVAQATVAELKEVDGVGPKRAEQIWLTLNGLHFQREVETTLTVSHLGTNTPETL